MSDRFGKLNEKEQIGISNWGTYYRGCDYKLDSNVAILELFPLFRNDMVWQNVNTARCINHDLFVSLQDFDKEDNWIITELRGASLRNMLLNGQSISQPIARDLLKQLLELLVYFESKNFVHGDIRPDTLLLPLGNNFIGASERQYLKLGFSIGGIWSDKSVTLAYRDMKYVAPELLNPDLGVVNNQSDIYSLGFTILELLTGPKFDSYFERINMSIEEAWPYWHGNIAENIPEVRTFVPDIDKDLEDALSLMLQKVQKNRPETAQDVLNQLNSNQSYAKQPVYHENTIQKTVVHINASEGNDVSDEKPKSFLFYLLQPYFKWPFASLVLVFLLLYASFHFNEPPLVNFTLELDPVNAKLYYEKGDEKILVKKVNGEYTVPRGFHKFFVEADGYVSVPRRYRVTSYGLLDTDSGETMKTIKLEEEMFPLYVKIPFEIADGCNLWINNHKTIINKKDENNKYIDENNKVWYRWANKYRKGTYEVFAWKEGYQYFVTEPIIFDISKSEKLQENPQSIILEPNTNNNDDYQIEKHTLIDMFYALSIDTWGAYDNKTREDIKKELLRVFNDSKNTRAIDIGTKLMKCRDDIMTSYHKVITYDLYKVSINKKGDNDYYNNWKDVRLCAENIDNIIDEIKGDTSHTSGNTKNKNKKGNSLHFDKIEIRPKIWKALCIIQLGKEGEQAGNGDKTQNDIEKDRVDAAMEEFTKEVIKRWEEGNAESMSFVDAYRLKIETVFRYAMKVKAEYYYNSIITDCNDAIALCNKSSFSEKEKVDKRNVFYFFLGKIYLMMKDPNPEKSVEYFTKITEPESNSDGTDHYIEARLELAQAYYNLSQAQPQFSEKAMDILTTLAREIKNNNNDYIKLDSDIKSRVYSLRALCRVGRDGFEKIEKSIYDEDILQAVNYNRELISEWNSECEKTKKPDNNIKNCLNIYHKYRTKENIPHK